MISERGVHIHGARNFRGKSRMAFYFLKFMIVATFVLIAAGGFLVFDAVSQPSNTQIVEVIGGAVLLALGLLTLYPQGQLAIQWLKEMRTHSGRGS